MKILAIDDERDIRLFLKDLLTQAGHDVTTAASGSEALAHTRDRQFDLVLLDVMMPSMDGRDVADVLVNRWDTSETPIVIITSSKEKAVYDWAKVSGFAGFIRKPFSNRELFEVLTRIEKRSAPSICIQPANTQDQTLKFRNPFLPKGE